MPVHILTSCAWSNREIVNTYFSYPSTVAPSAVVMNDFTWTLFYTRKLIYQDQEGSSTPGKPVLPLKQVNVPAIYTEANHEYRLSDPTAVLHSADWLHLNTFLLVEDALPRTRRLLNIWKNGFAVMAIQFAGHVTGSHHKYTLCAFWTQGSGIQSWLDWLHQNTGLPAEYAVRAQDSSKSGKPVLAWTSVGILAIFKPRLHKF